MISSVIKHSSLSDSVAKQQSVTFFFHVVVDNSEDVAGTGTAVDKRVQHSMGGKRPSARMWIVVLHIIITVTTGHSYPCASN